MLLSVLFLLIANVVSDERTYDFEHWDLDKDGVLTGYEVIANTFALYFFGTVTNVMKKLKKIKKWFPKNYIFS